MHSNETAIDQTRKRDADKTVVNAWMASPPRQKSIAAVTPPIKIKLMALPA